jgi:hypothetical protein
MKFFAALLALPLLLALPTQAQTPPVTLSPVAPTSAFRVWKPSEFRVANVPLNGANPYDPDAIAVDVAFTAPSRKTISLPAFWYRPFSRELKKEGAGDKASEREVLAPSGEGEWRVRWTPTETGTHAVRLSIRRAGKAPTEATSTCTVLGSDPKDKTPRGFARVNPRNARYLQHADGTPLPLLGENLCWHGARGTFDYDDWLAGYTRGRMNFTRLWMWNNSFGAEFSAGERGNYNLERLWKLDYVMQEAQRRGVQVMLCLDYHGIFQTKQDMWGGNDWWERHAYHRNAGGPLEKPNDFFTNSEAQVLYRKRLRYLVARYAAFPNLLSWQFFNEINNVYGDPAKTRTENRDALRLHPPDVVAWHDANSKYLRGLDPYGHMVTTSFGSAGEQESMWKLPGLSYANWHWYGNWSGRDGGVLGMTRAVGERFAARYAKPVSISEFGTSGLGWKPEGDPHRRGLHQAIWGGVFAGTAGTSAPWWWENIHRENLYPMWANLAAFLPRDFGSEKWAPRRVTAPDYKVELGQVLAGEAPFTEDISLVDSWGGKPRGPAILNRAGDGESSTLNGFLHGTSKPNERAPWKIQAHLKEGARLILHLNSVSNDAILVVRQNGREILRRELPNKDGGWERNNEYNEDIVVPLAGGRSDIEVENPGGDWFYLDWARIDGVLPARSPTQAAPLEAFALGDGTRTLLWAVDAAYAWPRGRNIPAQQVVGAHVFLPDLATGNYEAQWWNPRTGKPGAKTRFKIAKAGQKIALPAFETDVAAVITWAR